MLGFKNRLCLCLLSGRENAGWAGTGIPKKEAGGDTMKRQDECQFHKMDIFDKIYFIFYAERHCE
jgi:hypothetical protein